MDVHLTSLLVTWCLVLRAMPDARRIGGIQRLSPTDVFGSALNLVGINDIAQDSLRCTPYLFWPSVSASEWARIMSS